MELTWLGHAAVRLHSSSTNVLMDPFPEELGLRIPPQHAQASVVTVSSDAPYHSAAHVATADDKVIVIDGPGEYEASGIRIKGIRASRYIPDGPPAWNTVYTFETEGIVLCHLGDPDRLLTAREIEEIGSPHVLILPVGSRNGLSAADAVELVNAIAPRIIVPVMFAHPGNRVELREIGPFLQELGAKQPEPVSRLTVTRATLPEEAQVSMLQPAAGLI
jgi:L-ascorbate metabolism protein UlaG (beta-lactamase superfamily)